MTDHRRQLLDEILRKRSRVVAELPVDVDETSALTPWWALGIGRVAGGGISGPLLRRRRAALLCGVVALAWLEAIDAELGSDSGASDQTAGTVK